MSAFVNTNVKSLAVQQALVVNQRSMDKSMAQLATGQRINSVSDDAAGGVGASALQPATSAVSRAAASRE